MVRSTAVEAALVGERESRAVWLYVPIWAWPPAGAAARFVKVGADLNTFPPFVLAFVWLALTRIILALAVSTSTFGGFTLCCQCCCLSCLSLFELLLLLLLSLLFLLS